MRAKLGTTFHGRQTSASFSYNLLCALLHSVPMLALGGFSEALEAQFAVITHPTL